MHKQITNDFYIVCKSFSNSRSWGHIAIAYYKGQEVASSRIAYQNRTWERYQYESVMLKLINILDAYKNVPLKDRLSAYKIIKA